MYASVRQFAIAASVDRDANTRKLRDDFVPELRKLPGYIDFYFVDAGDTGVAVGLYRDKSSADRAWQLALDFLKTLGPGVTMTASHEGDVTVKGREPAAAV